MTIESVVLNEWHVLCALPDLAPGKVKSFTLLEVRVAATRSGDGAFRVWRCLNNSKAPPSNEESTNEELPLRVHCGHLWTSLGAPAHELFEVPEFAEADRRLVYCGTFGVHTSAPRAVENFLDLAHFPFVHQGVLGIEPHTEVKDYDVSVSSDAREVIARRCRFYQPMAGLAAKNGFEVDYVYRVPHPYCSVLYKSAAPDPSRNDVIAIFARPISEERVSATLFMALIDNESTDIGLLNFQQLIFSQDKPILENQRPRRLPLDPTAETSIRADRTSVTYRRWLHERGVRYGTVPWQPAMGPSDDSRHHHRG